MASISETHWTRILSYDLIDGDANTRNAFVPPAASDITAPHVEDRVSYVLPGERVELATADGHRIVAMRYRPIARKARLVVAGDIGVPQGFYRRFAQFAAREGYDTMTLDYRGIGLSAPPSLEGFRMDYFDWARYDLTAAISASYSRQVPLYVVGHAFGGHAFGLLPNHRLVTAFYTFGTGAGWHGWMSLATSLKVQFMWRVLGPLLSRKGYLEWSLLGLGEDLPKDVYEKMKKWSANPRYFFDDPAVAHIVRRFARVRAPLMAANSIDDSLAPPVSRDAFIAGYANAQREVLDIDPARLGLSQIGHLGYFRPAAVRLWKSALAWLDKCELQPPAVCATPQ
jgi:predicted alpha/beta hydrolase